MFIGLLGVVAIVGTEFAATDTTALIQMGIVVVGYALGPAILARPLDGLPTVGIMAVSLTLCAVLFAPIAATQLPAAMPSAQALIAIVVLATVCTAAAFLLFGALIDEVGPVRATVITYINPAVAAVLGVLVLRETFTVPMAIGFVLVIAGSMLAARRGQADAPEATPAAA
jgi:drug/metabolite transporter (DMT)-like permease